MRDLARYIFRPGVLTCDECRQVLKEREPDCESCEVQRLSSQLEPRHLFSRALIVAYGSLFVDGMGGVNASGLRWALEIEDIANEDKQFIIADITAYIEGAKEANKNPQPSSPPPKPHPKQRQSLPRIKTTSRR